MFRLLGSTRPMVAFAEKRVGRAPSKAGRPRPRPRVLPALTGLRIAAAVLVVMFHFLYIRVPAESGVAHTAAALVHRVVASGFTSVSFFFVLSGFILTYSYLEPDGRLRGTRARFYWARVARIYPIYLFTLLLAFLPYIGWGAVNVAVFQHGHFFPVLVLSPVFLQAWLPYPPTWNPPSWSLSAEAFFYVVFPLLVPLVGRLRRRYAPMAALGFWAISALIVVGYVIINPDRGQHGPWYSHHWLRILYDGPLPRLPEFFLGAAVARIFVMRNGGETGRSSRLNPALLSVIAALGIVIVWGIGPLPVALVNQVVLDPLFALLIYSVAFGKGPLAAVFSWPALVVLGEASYALYLLQWPVHDWLSRFFPKAVVTRAIAPDARDYVYFALFLVVSVAAALLAHYFIEQPARQAIQRFARRGEAARSEAARLPAAHDDTRSAPARRSASHPR